jgi:hypothetical protein
VSVVQSLLSPPSPSTRLYLLLFVGLVSALASVAGCREEGSREVLDRGTVVYLAFEGGFYGIVGDDGRRWDPANLPDEFAIDSLRVSFRAVVTDQPTFHMWGRTVKLLAIERIGSPPDVNLDPFIALARRSDCAEVRNRLFLIDEHLVFWDRASDCKDAEYAQTLFGRTVEHVICVAHDSIAGPVEQCHDRERYQVMFETILDHLDRPDLGLGPDHTVKLIEI